MDKIDFVITWVDGSDPNWLKEKQETLGQNFDINDTIARYRDWDNLKYLFRGIEKNANWVNKVYFVTWGHLPNWLNVDNPKLVIVNHKDFIPEKYLPTYSSHVLELNFHRINGLSDKFVYFNDDTFIIDKVFPKDFFVNDKPVDFAILTSVVPKANPFFDHILLNNTSVINKYYDMKKVVFKNLSKWFSFHYGFEQFRTLLLLPWNNFPGFKFTHLSSALLKQTYIDLWGKEEELLDNTCTHKTRNITDVNQYLLKQWQVVNNNVYPMKRKFGYFATADNDNSKLISILRKRKYKMVCINDNDDIDDFESVKKSINDSLDYLLPEKSSFER